MANSVEHIKAAIRDCVHTLEAIFSQNTSHSSYV